MKNELQYSFARLKEAAAKLDEGIDEAEDELDRDGVITEIRIYI